MGPEEGGTQEIRTHFQPGFSTLRASSALHGERTSAHLTSHVPPSSPTPVNQLCAPKHEIQLLLLLGLAMIVFNGQKIIQHLKNTIKKFASVCPLGFWAGSKEGFPLRSSF